MAFKEQKITTGKYIFRLLKFLSRKGAIANLKTLISSRPGDEISMVEFLERHAAERPDDTALLFEDQRFSWS